MTREQQFFVQALSDHLNGISTEDPHGPDWNTVHAYARMHQVSGIIYTQAKNYMPPEALDVFRQETIATYYYHASREEDFRIISESFRDADIEFFVIKGPEVAALYPVPKLRAMGDIDLVVHSADREECHRILTEKGFESVSRQEDREWQYYRNNLETELHDRLIYRESVNEKGQEAFFNNCWHYVKDGRLDWNFHLLFLVFHLRKHLMNMGAGFRQFMDLAVVARKTGLDWAWLEVKLKATGMYEFACRCYGFIHRWFSISTPIMKEVDDAFFEEATRKIFADGIFGFDNVENAGSEVINKIRKQRFRRLGMAGIAIRYVFPGCRELKNLKEYSYLNKAPVLLPVAWIHRILISIRGKKKERAMNNLKKSFVPRDKIDQRKEQMRKWGL